MTFGMRLLLLAVGAAPLPTVPTAGEGKGRDGAAPVVSLDLAGRSLSVGFVNLDITLLSPGNVAHLLETNSNGY